MTTTKKKTSKRQTKPIGSALVRALEAVWAAIRERHPELPEVVIITGSGTEMLGLKWGHYWHHGWANGRFVATADGVIERERKPELFVSGETLGVGGTKTVQTLLHEATHALAAARGIKDTSRQGRWHNKRFLEVAEELGLEYRHEQADKSIGYSAVEITDATRKAYADVIDQLDKAIVASLELPGWAARMLGRGAGGNGAGGDGGDKVKGRPRRKGGGTSTALPKATCQCETPRIIRVARSTLELAPITCGGCGSQFTIADGSAPPEPGPAQPAQPEPEVTRVVELEDGKGHKVTVDQILDVDNRYRYEVAGSSGYRAVIEHCGHRPEDLRSLAEKVLKTYRPSAARPAMPKRASRGPGRYMPLEGEHSVAVLSAGQLGWQVLCDAPRCRGVVYHRSGEIGSQLGAERLCERGHGVVAQVASDKEARRIRERHVAWHAENFPRHPRLELDEWIMRNSMVRAPEPDRAELERQLAVARAERDAKS